MKIFTAVLITIIIFVFFSLCTGLVLQKKFKKVFDTSVSVIAAGFCAELILYFLINSVVSLVRGSLLVSGCIWLAAEGSIVLWAFIRDDFWQYLKSVFNKRLLKKPEVLPVIILIILQVVGVTVTAYENPGALMQAKDIADIYISNIPIFTKPMLSLWAFSAKISGIHPLAAVYTVSPFVMIPGYYIIYWGLSKKLFTGRYDRLFMMLLVCLLNFWGYQSEYLLKYTLLYSWFSGTVFLVHGILPMSLGMLLSRKDKLTVSAKEQEKPEEWHDSEVDDWEEDDMKNHRIINSRTVAIGLLAVVIMLVASVYIMNRKINSLYEATVNLQAQVNEGCSIYEFRSEGTGETEAYLIRQTNGSIILIGGGDKENAEALYDYIKGYSDKVDAWYLKSDKSGDTGAYTECISKGIKVGNTYYLNIKEVK